MDTPNTQVAKQDDLPVEAPAKPLQFTWIIQRQITTDPNSALDEWKFGFIATDGAEVRVSFRKTDMSQEEGNAVYYVTFFSNHNPISFTKWDTSLSHEDSLVAWITITHGIVDFMRKANPSVLIMDDLGNGKLKMVLRSVSMDLIEALPEYEIEQTRKHHFRTFYQIKKKGTPSAFDDRVRGTGQEGQTAIPSATQGEPPVATNNSAGANDSSLPQDQTLQHTAAPDQGTASPESQQADPSADQQAPEAAPEQPPQQTKPQKGLTVEIGRDYSVVVRAKDGHAVDRYKAINPRDILRWINTKGYAANKMVIVDQAQPSLIPGDRTEERPEKKSKDEQIIPNQKTNESFVVDGNVVRVLRPMSAKQAAAVNQVLNAKTVRQIEEGVEFEFDTDKNMSLKASLIELTFDDLKKKKSRKM